MATSTDQRLGTTATLADRVRAAQLPAPAERRRIREQAGATIQAVADELEVDRLTIYRWERGHTRPGLEHAAAYRALLDELAEASGSEVG